MSSLTNSVDGLPDRIGFGLSGSLGENSREAILYIFLRLFFFLLSCSFFLLCFSRDVDTPSAIFRQDEVEVQKDSLDDQRAKQRKQLVRCNVRLSRFKL
jgi:hypothetical protein